MRKAFTLIELLVVIAIIAILAAILFPVFAQAKLAAKKTKSLSNVKNIGTAYHIYLSDNDDVTPSVWGTNDPANCLPPGNISGCGNEWWMPIFPYFKSIDLLYSDERNDPDNHSVRTGVYGAKKLSAYGYNWGPFGWRGGGLLEKQVAVPRPGGGFGNMNAGKSATSLANPASVFAFGDTYDTPRATVGLGFSGDTYNGFTNSGLRYGGTFNYAFADGHAKAIHVRGGILPGAFNNRFIMPKNLAAYGAAHCADPEQMILEEDGTTSKLNTTPMPPSMLCKDYTVWLQTTINTACVGTGTGSACYFGN
ncbi:MAG TPA: prepilin-type N-terminal cleavage/methylation domain-containing protein [Fimbriimonas sp.]|nr:prepilin-type N-terminal cleavage/methylation domain-containing protein [Fimbriimonas sp.]